MFSTLFPEPLPLLLCWGGSGNTMQIGFRRHIRNLPTPLFTQPWNTWHPVFYELRRQWKVNISHKTKRKRRNAQQVQGCILSNKTLTFNFNVSPTRQPLSAGEETSVSPFRMKGWNSIWPAYLFNAKDKWIVAGRCFVARSRCSGSYFVVVVVDVVVITFLKLSILNGEYFLQVPKKRKIR